MATTGEARARFETHLANAHRSLWFAKQLAEAHDWWNADMDIDHVLKIVQSITETSLRGTDKPAKFDGVQRLI